MNIPYTVEARPDTGMNNGRMGMWLFIASEIMLFGGLFSAYALLRVNSTDWLHGPDVLNVVGAAVNTVVLLATVPVLAMASKAIASGDLKRGRLLLVGAVVLGCVFMGIKGLEYSDKLSHGHYPATHVFYGIYFVITGLHVLHVLGGVLAVAWHAGPGARLYATHPEQFTNRIAVTRMYWTFVDIVWLVIFPVLYLT